MFLLLKREANRFIFLGDLRGGMFDLLRGLKSDFVLDIGENLFRLRFLKRSPGSLLFRSELLSCLECMNCDLFCRFKKRFLRFAILSLPALNNLVKNLYLRNFLKWTSK